MLLFHPGNMRGFGMGGQQFRQFFTAGARSSLLGPVPMGMAIKSPIMGFPAARAFHPHSRFFNAGTASSSSSISATVITKKSFYLYFCVCETPVVNMEDDRIAFEYIFELKILILTNNINNLCTLLLQQLYLMQ